MMGTILFATHPSRPSQAAGSAPGAAEGMKYVVWGVWESTCTPRASGLSSPFAFKDGDTSTVTVTLPA